MNLAFLAVLFFVVLLSIILQLALKCSYAVSAVITIISLIVFAFFIDTLTTIFIVWIVIYALASLLTAFLVNRFVGYRDDCIIKKCHRRDNDEF